MVCKLCALIKDSFSFERYCTDCWEGMTNG
jgi:hypothetical protein